jgi:ribosomal protein S27AE
MSVVSSLVLGGFKTTHPVLLVLPLQRMVLHLLTQGEVVVMFVLINMVWHVFCPKCGLTIKAAEENTSQEYVCGKCGKRFFTPRNPWRSDD